MTRQRGQKMHVPRRLLNIAQEQSFARVPMEHTIKLVEKSGLMRYAVIWKLLSDPAL